MSQVYKSVSSTPSVATSYVTDVSGPAVPQSNSLSIVGGSGVSTDGSVAGTVTINLTDVVSSYVSVTSGDSPYTVTSTDNFISCDTSGGAITIRLEDAPTTYDKYVIKDRSGNAGTNNITITTAGGAVLIDGAATQLLTNAYESAELLFNGTSYEMF